MALVADDIKRDLLGLIARQRFHRGLNPRFFKFAESLDLEWSIDGEEQIGDARMRVEHRGEDGVEFGRSHEMI